MADEQTLRDNLREGSSIGLIHYGFSMLQTACEHHNNFDHDCHHSDRDFSCMSCCIVNCPLLVEV